MKRRVTSLAVLLLLAFGAFLAGRLTTPARSAAALQPAKEGYQFQFLEVGKTYTFTWQGSRQSGTLAEVPRAGWVKVKAPAQGADPPVLWVNLATVESISQGGKK